MEQLYSSCLCTLTVVLAANNVGQFAEPSNQLHREALPCNHVWKVLQPLSRRREHCQSPKIQAKRSSC